MKQLIKTVIDYSTTLSLKNPIFISIFCLSMLFSSCSSQNSNFNVKIIAKDDTIKVNTIYKAELYVDYDRLVLPNFHIVIGNDTSILHFDEEKGCGIFRASNDKKGKQVYNGFVDYLNNKGSKRKDEFQIVFYIY